VSAGPSKKAKKNKNGIDRHIMDPVTRSTTQCAPKEGHNTSCLTSPTLEERQVLSLEFGQRTSGPKWGKVLASTYRLCCSLDGLPQILEFQRRSRVWS